MVGIGEGPGFKKLRGLFVPNHHSFLEGNNNDDHRHYLTKERHDDDNHIGALPGLGAWIDYSPSAQWTATITNPTGWSVGYYEYTKIGKIVLASFVFNSGAAANNGSGGYRWSIPVTADFPTSAAVGHGYIFDNSAGSLWLAYFQLRSSTTIEAFIHATAGGYTVEDAQPYVWDTSDHLKGFIMYKTASP